MASPHAAPHAAAPAPTRRPSRVAALAAMFAAMLVLAACAETPEDLEASTGGRPEDGARPSAGSLLRIAELTRRGGDLASAINLYHRASLAAPNDPKPLIKLGEVLLEAKAYREAEAAFRRALQIAADQPEALRGLGHALIALDRPREAIAPFRAANEARPDPRALAGLGVALDMAGDHRAAQEVYRSGLKTYPNDLALENNLGLSLALTGDLDEAIRILRRVATDPAATARNRQNLALVYGLAGRDGLAAEIGRLDLDAGEVEKNLAYYLWLRNHKAPGGAEKAAKPTRP